MISKSKKIRNTVSLYRYICVTLLSLFLLPGLSYTANAGEQIFVFSTKNANQNTQTRALTTIKSRLSRAGFFVRDNVSLLSSIGIVADSPKAFVLRRSETLAQLVGNSTLIFVDSTIIDAELSRELRMSAELYSTASNSFLTSWSVPNTILTIPNDCSQACSNGLLADEAERMADTLGASLVQLLQRPTGASDLNGNTIAILDVEIIDFTNAEVMQLVDLMRNEFPGFVDITRVQSSGPRYRMLYHTSADLQKLGTWVDISLEEIGLKIDTDVQRIITEKRIDIRRIDPATSKGSTGNTLKYN